ncbi:MAG: DNA repair protein RecN [Bacteroidaceae bacterium]|nr:DNA repair protein RecN [Bacteroidaceae bacterium]
MLRHLHISNYALIEELDLDLQDGFSVITGETGAGKSILLGAIALITGQRADSQSIKEGAAKCVVEAEFDISNHRLESFFEENGFDFDPESCTLRRELTAAGKSRAFINDSPATLAQMKELGANLIDIHSQHQNLLLSHESFQLNVLDTMANNATTLDAYREAYYLYKGTEKRLAEAIEVAERSKNEVDYLSYQLEQLQALDPHEDEEKDLEEENKRLEHAEEIKTSLYEAASLLDGGNDYDGLVDLSNRTRSIVENLTDVYPQAETLAERLESVYIELKDLSREISQQADDLEYDPQRLEEVKQRLDLLYTLEKKHGAADSTELVEVMHNIEKKLDLITNADEKIAQLERERDEARLLIQQRMTELTATRKKAIKDVESEVGNSLLSLGMPHAVFRVQLSAASTPTADGNDRVTFLFAANKNASPRAIADVASGGEISRVMLAVKAMTSRRAKLPTIIFDEIDTGVSGRIAEAMGYIMRNMVAEQGGRQVIAITHLPQIAACGQTHYCVYKEDSGLHTVSSIRRLSDEERIMEIAHMLSGNNVTAAAIDNARELLNGQ